MNKVKKLIILLSITGFSACGKINSQTAESASNVTVLAPGDEVRAPVISPTVMEISIDIKSTATEIIVDVSDKDKVKELQILVNSEDQGDINQLPFKYPISTSTTTAQTIKVVVNVTTMSGQLISESEDIKREGSEVAKPPTENVITNPVISANCLNESQFDACIFYKNPVAHLKRALTTKITYGDDLSGAQTYAVKITGRTDPTYLKNNSIDVFATSGVKAKISSGNGWKANYKSDFGVHKLVQVLSYYWANLQIQFMKTKGGAFYAENKNIKIDAFNNNVKNNAYWNGSSVVLGNFGTQEIALSSEVLLHEMGHANLDYASNRQIRLTSNFCATKMGCIGAIHEGQADIHAFLFFEGDSKMSQTITNTMNGWANRNPANYTAKNLDYFFNTHSGGGEIHGMGTAYTTILWQIMMDSSMNRDDFAKMFSMHLARLTNSSDFRSAKVIWLNLSDVYFAKKYNSIIENYFTKMGVN